MWDALTWQGKAVVVSVAAGILVVVALLSNRGGGSGQSPVSVIETIAPQVALAIATPPPSATAPAQPTATNIPSAATSTPAPSSTTAAPTPTRPAATAPAQPSVVPTATVEPATVVPTAPAGCSAVASVSDQTPKIGDLLTLTARLTCGGQGVAAAQMTALITSSSGQATCAGVADGGGRATCTLQVGGPAGSQVMISACFSYQSQVICGSASFTPRQQ
jgi:hypothetical protein